VAAGSIQLSLFDKQNLAEINSPDYPGEPLMACFNPLLPQKRRRKRQQLFLATESDLGRIAAEVSRRKKSPLPEATIAPKVGKVLHRFKLAKHFELTTADSAFR
jgi:hypothetical protein